MTALREIPPIVAILRGVHPDEVVAVADVLVESGIHGIEVPLNSPDALTSFARLAAAHGGSCLCGAGTVLTAAQVDEVKAAGGSLIVSPNTDPRVIRRCAELGMIAMPGFATATEAFVALEAGAQALKLFPAATYGATHLSALGAVLPPLTRVYAVGGVNAATIPQWSSAGAAGFGVGTEIYTPGRALADMRARAKTIVAAFEASRQSATH